VGGDFYLAGFSCLPGGAAIVTEFSLKVLPPRGDSDDLVAEAMPKMGCAHERRTFSTA